MTLLRYIERSDKALWTELNASSRLGFSFNIDPVNTTTDDADHTEGPDHAEDIDTSIPLIALKAHIFGEHAIPEGYVVQEDGSLEASIDEECIQQDLDSRI